MVKHDWDKWRRAYVVGDDNVTLPSIAMIPGAPSLPSLKRVCASELWADQRKRYRVERDTHVIRDDAAVSAVQRVEQIIDAAEMLTQHNQVAKLLISQGVQALRGRDPAKLSDKDALAFLKAGIEIQRLTEGLATERQAVTHDGGMEIKVTRQIIDAP
jgi:P2-related tail formation protein